MKCPFLAGVEETSVSVGTSGGRGGFSVSTAVSAYVRTYVRSCVRAYWPYVGSRSESNLEGIFSLTRVYAVSLSFSLDCLFGLPIAGKLFLSRYLFLPGGFPTAAAFFRDRRGTVAFVLAAGVCSGV